jgi:probable HAF family extracellular repeat protein
MRTTRRPLLALTAALATLAACGTEETQAPVTEPTAAPALLTTAATSYTVKDLGTLGGSISYAADINNKGAVVGTSYRSSGQPHAFLWRAGTMKDLGGLAGGLSEAAAVNDSDVVVGYSTVAGGAQRAVRWQNGKITNLGTLGGRNSGALAVNDAGIIVGWSENAQGQQRAFIWQNGAMKELPALPGGAYASANGINKAGKVVGWSNNKNGKAHAVSWKSGVIKDLGTAGRQTSVAVAINTRGQITGSIGAYPDAVGEELDESDPFIYLNEVFTSFRTRQFTSEAQAINSDGVVVGYDEELRDPEGYVDAWVKPVGAQPFSLPKLAAGNSSARGINDFGNIVGSSDTKSGGSHAVLWRHQ